MQGNQQSKEYNTPQFQFIRQDEHNKVFFAASETPEPEPKSAGATLSNIGSW